MIIRKYAVPMAHSLIGRAEEIELLYRAAQMGTIVVLPHDGVEGEMQFMSGSQFVRRFNRTERAQGLPVARRVS